VKNTYTQEELLNRNFTIDSPYQDYIGLVQYAGIQLSKGAIMMKRYGSGNFQLHGFKLEETYFHEDYTEGQKTFNRFDNLSLDEKIKVMQGDIEFQAELRKISKRKLKKAQ
jgi:predicted metallopeptidase